MGRLVRERRLETREARERLRVQREPYWRLLEPGLHLGYSKGPRGTAWFARYRIGGRYLKKGLGIPDDSSDANGVEILSFGQAQEAARRFRQQRIEDRHPDRAPMTVRTIVSRYLEWFALERKSLDITRRSFDAHILPVFGDQLASELTKSEIQRWRDALVRQPPRKRTRFGRKQAYRELRTDPDGQRARKATVNRLLGYLKAALNYARRDGVVSCNPVWQEVRPFRNADSVRVRFLSQEEAHRLVNACAPDFRWLVQGALYTGARYKELTHVLVGDYDATAETLLFRETKNGMPRHAYLAPVGKAFFDSMVLGRSRGETMFQRADGQPWDNAQQTRRMKEASAAASIQPHVTFHVLRHTFAAGLAMQRVPLQVISEGLGHRDTRITEKHYAHLAPSYVARTIRENLPDFGDFRPGNVVVPFPVHQRPNSKRHGMDDEDGEEGRGGQALP